MSSTNNSITLLLLTHNSSADIKTHFTWLKKLSNLNEIIVVDDNSTDNSIEVVKKLASKKRTVKVFERGLNGDFSAQRQFGVSQSTNDWILWLDPDEKPSSKLIAYLDHFDDNQYNVSFKRLDIFLDTTLKHGEVGANHFLRFFHKNHGKFVGKVHEVWQSDQPVSQTKLIIYHHPHSNLTVFFQKINFYSSLRAQELYDQHQTANIFDCIIYPKAKFVQNYFLRQGFKDGTPGIILALGMSFHSFLVRAKLWHLSQKSSP